MRRRDPSFVVRPGGRAPSSRRAPSEGGWFVARVECFLEAIGTTPRPEVVVDEGLGGSWSPWLTPRAPVEWLCHGAGAWGELDLSSEWSASCLASAEFSQGLMSTDARFGRRVQQSEDCKATNVAQTNHHATQRHTFPTFAFLCSFSAIDSFILCPGTLLARKPLNRCPRASRLLLARTPQATAWVKARGCRRFEA